MRWRGWWLEIRDPWSGQGKDRHFKSSSPMTHFPQSDPIFCHLQILASNYKALMDSPFDEVTTLLMESPLPKCSLLPTSPLTQESSDNISVQQTIFHPWIYVHLTMQNSLVNLKKKLGFGFVWAHSLSSLYHCREGMAAETWGSWSYWRQETGNKQKGALGYTCNQFDIS